MSGTQTSASVQAATPGNWIIQTINGMQYMVLLPANYDPSIKYATVLYLHQLDEGTYGPQLLQDQINAWFNTTAVPHRSPVDHRRAAAGPDRGQVGRRRSTGAVSAPPTPPARTMPSPH